MRRGHGLPPESQGPAPRNPAESVLPPDRIPWEDCLKLPDPEGCLDGLDLTGLTLQQIAATLNDPEIHASIRSRFLQRLLLQRHPSEFAAFAEELQALLHGRGWRRFTFLESAISGLAASHPAWVEDLARLLTAQDLFEEDASFALLSVMPHIPVWPDPLMTTLHDGGLGVFGGSPDQVERAFQQTLFRLSQVEAPAVFGYLQASLDSPHYADPRELGVAQHAIHFLGRFAGQSLIEGPQVMGFLDDAFQHQHFRSGAAAQFLAETESGSFGGLSAEQTRVYRAQAERIREEG